MPTFQHHEDAEPQRKRQRRQEDLTTTTDQVYHELVESHQLSLSKDRFVGLCGYLCTILRAGYHLRVTDMDKFIYRYQDFEDHLTQLERRRRQGEGFTRLAYHQWLSENWLAQGEDDGGGHSETILDEEGLRKIWRENPYCFLRAEHSTRAIASITHKESFLPPE